MAITRTAITDDDGSRTTGTVLNNAWKTELYNQIDAADAAVVAAVPSAPGVTAPTTTGTQTALAIPTGTGNLVINANNATLLTVQGITAGLDGQLLTIFSKGAGQIDFAHLHASGTALGKLRLFATSGATSLAAGVGVLALRYDATVTQWRLAEHVQGDYIEYGSTSTIVGWSSRTTTVVRYYLVGRQLTVVFDLEGTSNATTATFTVPYTASIAGQCGNLQVVNNGAVTTTPGLAQTSASSAVIGTFINYAGAAWTNVNGKNATGAIVFQAQ